MGGSARTAPVDRDRGRPKLALFLFYGVCRRDSKTTAVAACVSRDVMRSQIREALQFHRRLSTVETDVGVALAHGDIAVTLQVGQRLAFQIKLVVTRHEIGNDVRAAYLIRSELEQVMPGTAPHCLVARAAN